MKKLLLSLILILSFVQSVQSQAPIRAIESPQYSQTFTVTNTTATSGIDVRQLNINYWRMCFTIASGTPTFTVILQKSDDNSSFSTLVSSGSVTATDCTAITEGNTNYIKLNPSAYSGASSSVLVTIGGWITNPDIGSIAGASTTTPGYTRIQDGTSTLLATVANAGATVTSATSTGLITESLVFGKDSSNVWQTIEATILTGTRAGLSVGALTATGDAVTAISGPNSQSYGFGAFPWGFNGTNWDRTRTANGASNTTGTGLLGTHNLLWDGTNYQRNTTMNNLSLSGVTGSNFTATTPYLAGASGFFEANKSIASALSTGVGTSAVQEAPSVLGTVAVTAWTTGGLVNSPNLVAAGAHNLDLVDIINNSAVGSCYLQIFDAATAGAVTIGSTAPILSFGVGSSGAAGIQAESKVVQFPHPVNFALGIVVAGTTTRAGGTSCGTGLDVNILYK